MLPEKRKEKYEIKLSEHKEAFLNPKVQARFNDVDKLICERGISQPISMINDREMIEPISAIANLTARDAGIKAKLDKYDLARFMEIIKRYYRELTLEEVKLAFELAIVGELDYFIPKDRNGNPDKNHYQVFSLEYITKILNAYQKKRTEVWGRAIAMLPEKSQALTEEEKKEIDISVRTEVRNKYVRYRDQKIRPSFYVPIVAFLVLRDAGVISSLEFEVSKESYDKAMEQIIKDKTASTEKKRAALNYEATGTISDILHSRAGAIEADNQIASFFDRMISENVDINKLLNLEQ